MANGTAGTNPTGNVLTNDTDVDTGDTKTVSGVAAGVVGSASTNVGSAVAGTYGSINISSTGAYTYTVDNSNATVQALRTSGNTLTDVFTYTMQDTAAETSTTQITVTIQGANDAPNNITGTSTIAENSTNGSVAGTVTGQDVDTGDAFTYSLTDTAGGRFAINSSTGQVTVADGSLLDFEANTSHTIVVQVTDTALATFSKTMTVSVTNVNEAPVAVADAATAVEAGGTANATAGTNPTGNVLTNDTDVDAGDTKMVTGVAAGVVGSASGNIGSAVTGTYGSINLAANGAYTYTLDNSNSTVQALRTSADTLSDVFTYTMKDTSGVASTTQLTVTILGANDTPSITSVQTTYLSDMTPSAVYNLYSRTKDLDAAGGPLNIDGVTYSKGIGTHPNNGSGYVEYAIGGNTSFKAVLGIDDSSGGSPSVIYRVYLDGALAYTSATVTSTTPGINLNIDTTGKSTLRLEVDPNGTNNWDWASWFDARLESVVAFSENSTSTVYQTTATDVDAGSVLTYSITGADAALFDINTTTGAVTFKAAPNYESPTDIGADNVYNLNVVISDGIASSSSAVVISVANVNESPTGVLDTATAVEAGGTANGTAGTNPTGNVLTNDTDVDTGDTKTVSGVAAGVVGSASTNVGSAVTGSYGSINISSTGAYTYTVDNSNATVQALRTSGNTLTDVFTYTMRDTAGATSTTQITVTIQGANDAPNDITGTLTIAENSAYGAVVGTASGQDVDTGDAFTYSLTDTAGGRFAINAATGQVTVADGSLIDFETDTSHTITVRVTDLAGATFDKVLTVSVTNTNDAPVLNASASQTMGLGLEGATNPTGVTVASMIVDGSITDADGSVVEAIAITSLNTSLGTWQYSVNGGTSWLTIDANLINNTTNELALLLGPTAQLRLIPFGDVNGSVNDAITFRAWDQTSGSEGQYTVISSTGGSTPFSSASDKASITVTPVNDTPTFLSGDGIVTTEIGPSIDSARSVTVQPDGKILVGGSSHNGSNHDFALVRYNADGSLDTSFGTGGKVTTAIGTGSDIGGSVTIQPDGKIVVGGTARIGSTDDFALVRYNADGTLDTSFGTGGMVTTAIGTSTDFGYSVTIQPDGKIVVAGYARIGSTDDFALVRYNANGTLDTSFGTGGKVTTAIGTSVDWGRSVTIQPDGKIVVGGYATIGGTADFALMRYNANGSLDTSFGTGGKVTTAIGTSTDRGDSVTVQPDGKVLVGGYAFIAGTQDFALVRYNADGSLDATFGTGGKVTTDIGTSDDQGYSVTIQPDGKIVVAGTTTEEFALARYNADGTFDTTFGSGGIVTTRVGWNTSIAYSVTLQSDGKIVVSGTTTEEFALARYNADGSLDTTFNRTVTLDGNVNYTEKGSPVVLDSDVRVFDAELSSTNFSSATLTLVRNGGASAQDLFAATGTLGALTQGGNLTIGGTTIGTVTTNSGGTLVLSFNSSATNTLVNSAMQQIAYANSSEAPASSVQIDWTFSDGNSGAQGTGGALTATGNVIVNITAVNDAPVAVNDSFTTSEDTAVTFDVRSNDSDPES
ncbi:MAG: beta strand repeat-containing protein, partial [Planctomycetota bacterium]